MNIFFFFFLCLSIEFLDVGADICWLSIRGEVFYCGDEWKEEFVEEV